MQKRIFQFVNDSVLNQFYGKAIDCVIALREGCIREDEPEPFNKFLKSIQTSFPGKRRYSPIVL